jgi:2-C-methyl-D-erythritol 4-phosphate cytidylyltransferase/2-C-methyl-D-erythritol 2,4-cyclodiphosphate synthase
MTAKQALSPSFHVLIAAGGQGTRFGDSPLPKQYTLLAGKPLLRHAIEAFLATPHCAGVRVVISQTHTDLYQKSVTGLNLPPPLTGGNERNESIYKALQQIDDLDPEDIILIHDAARPCITPASIAELVNSLKTERAATLALPVSATLRKSNDHNAAEIIDRTGVHAMQTPQAFRYGDLLKAHQNAKSENITDDTMLVSALGIAVKIVPGSPENIKITYPEDLAMAEKLLNTQRIFITGTGFDVHAFDADRTGPVRLCGVDVPHTHVLKGHSDADVGLHALTDAILGAIGEGDIGRHFPPADQKYKNMDSAIFLQEAAKMVSDKVGKIENVDVTLICEFPKITPHADAMKKRIAEILSITPARVNVKATTTEQLGFTGRGEGIAAQAIATLSLPANAYG